MTTEETMQSDHLSICQEANRQLRMEIESVKQKRDELHSIICSCLSALGNGSGAAPECSIQFLSGAPEEIRLVVADLKQQRDELREAAELAKNALSEATYLCQMYGMIGRKEQADRWAREYPESYDKMMEASLAINAAIAKVKP